MAATAAGLNGLTALRATGGTEIGSSVVIAMTLFAWSSGGGGGARSGWNTAGQWDGSLPTASEFQWFCEPFKSLPKRADKKRARERERRHCSS